MQYVDVIVGGQYGSEAKGHVTAQIVKAAIGDGFGGLDGRVINVRVAGPNAGHTVYDAEGNKFAFRSLPVGAVIDPEVQLYIAPGSEVDIAVLESEIALAREFGHSVIGRLFVSRQATVIEPRHKTQEAALVGAIGSTGKGIGAARAERLLRQAQTMGDYCQGGLYPWEWAEPEDLYASDTIVHDEHTHVIIEGTQGYGLSLRASGHYPQVTSSDARSVDFLAMAGIDPTRCGIKLQNWVVARVYPIRVAGNSGPMKGETTWEALGLAEERTTVTQKVRRVGEWDAELVARAIQANGGHQAHLVITMLDQVIPELADIDPDNFDPDHPALKAAAEWTDEHCATVGANIAGITFGPTKMLFTEHALNPTDGNGISPEAAQSALRAMLQGEVDTDGR